MMFEGGKEGKTLGKAEIKVEGGVGGQERERTESVDTVEEGVM